MWTHLLFLLNFNVLPIGSPIYGKDQIQTGIFVLCLLDDYKKRLACCSPINRYGNSFLIIGVVIEAVMGTKKIDWQMCTLWLLHLTVRNAVKSRTAKSIEISMYLDGVCVGGFLACGVFHGYYKTQTTIYDGRYLLKTSTLLGNWHYRHNGWLNLIRLVMNRRSAS